MAQLFNKSGPLYSLGLITVTNAGTPVALDVNVSVADNTGAGVTQPPLKCRTIKVFASVDNTKEFFIVYKTTAAGTGNGTSVILAVAPGRSEQLEASDGSMAFTLNNLGADAITNGNKAWVSVVIA